MKTIQKLLLALALFTVLPALATAQATAFPEFQYGQHELNRRILNYRVLYPKDFDKTKEYPLFLFLHGMGERGGDNETQLTHGAKLFRDSIEKYPAVVVFPQCPVTDYWANVFRPDLGGKDRKYAFFVDEDYNHTLKIVADMVDSLLTEPFIDQDRLYVSGLSMGGFGTWELLWRMPEKIAAAAPICGGGPLSEVDRMSEVPIWAFHGDSDSVVDVNYTTRMETPIREAGGDIKVSIYPGVDHNSWDNAFAEPRFLSWFFSKRKQQ